MPRPPTLIPYHEKSRDRWVLRVPAKLSDTGKVKRETFQSEQQALDRAEEIKKLQVESADAVRMAGPQLIRTAMNYDDLFRDVYGFEGGLEEACEAFVRQVEAEQRSVRFVELIDDYEQHHRSHWSRGHTGRWNWFRGHVQELEAKPIASLDLKFWRDWLGKKSNAETWSDKTFNEVAGLLSSVWKNAVLREVAERNPIDGVARRKIRRKAVAVYSVEQVKKLMACAWKHDREMVPYFAITIFAGLRPDDKSEITRLTWDDVNFEENWIRVGTNFDNKTRSKRFVPMEPNLPKWLEPWKDATGRVTPRNLIRRRQYLTRGKYQSPPKTPESEWKQLVPYGTKVRDITRHTYGSYLEAKYRDRNKVMEYMGTGLDTYEQHYRNARSPQEAEELGLFQLCRTEGPMELPLFIDYQLITRLGIPFLVWH